MAQLFSVYETTPNGRSRRLILNTPDRARAIELAAALRPPLAMKREEIGTYVVLDDEGAVVYPTDDDELPEQR